MTCSTNLSRRKLRRSKLDYERRAKIEDHLDHPLALDRKGHRTGVGYREIEKDASSLVKGHARQFIW